MFPCYFRINKGHDHILLVDEAIRIDILCYPKRGWKHLDADEKKPLSGLGLNSIPKDAGQAKAIFVWYPKARIDLKMIHDENDILTDDELVVARDFLKPKKYGCLCIRNEYPGGYRLLNAP